MSRKPRPWQSQAARFALSQPRVNLWMDPGLGKTGSVLLALETMRLSGSRFFPALVIGPLRVARKVWSDECQKWDAFSDLRVSVICGTPAQRRAALRADADIYCINYENLVWLVNECKADWPFLTVVADESTKLKGFRLRNGGRRAAALAKVAKLVRRWMNLTGTPAPNGLKDLWGQMWVIDAGERLGRTYTAFKDRWFDENEYTRQLVPRDWAEREIMDAIADVTLSISAKDCFDVREPVHIQIPVALPAKVRKHYRQMEDTLIAELEAGEVAAENAADKSMKLLQITSGAVFKETGSKEWHLLHDEKLDALKSLIEDLNGAPLLVAYHFRSDLQRILEAVPGARQLKTRKDEDDWNAGKVPVMVFHPASAGHGLNLQFGGHHMAIFTPWWDLENYLQALERIGPVRQLQSGFDRPVFVYHIVCEDTVDEVVVDRRTTKMSVQESLRRRAKR